MKNLILLILPVILLVASCDNKTKSDNSMATESKDSTTGGQNMTANVDSMTPGTPTAPAMVFDYKTLNPLSDATITASLGAQAIQTVTSDAKGNYSFTKLVNGQTYTYAASKTGYITAQLSGPYEGTNSLPGFSLKQ
jgi:hypothetical protein